MILPSTSDFESPAGAEYHLDPRGRAAGAEQVDLMERQGVITREAGSLDEATIVVQHRKDCIKPVRIILEGDLCEVVKSVSL